MSLDLNELMSRFDEHDCQLSEFEISSKINSETNGDNSFQALAERLAFGFCEDYLDKKNGWGTYYGPMMVWRGEDGNFYESPSIKMIDSGIIDYWNSRAEKAKNPLLKSRYYGLVWDLSEMAIDVKPDYKVAINYIECLIDVVDAEILKYPTEAITKITRAYKVASKINNSELTIKTIESAIKLEESIAVDDKAGTWGFCFDLFVINKCKHLTQAQESKLLSDLELRLARVSGSPWTCESAGIPLANYYRSKGKNDEVIRVIKSVGSSFENACDGLAAIQISSWLQHMHEVYIRFNMKDDAERIAKKIAQIGKDVVDDMHSISHEMTIPKDELEAYLNEIVSGGYELALTRIAVKFIPNRELIEDQVLKMAKEYPLTYLFGKVLQDHKGRPVAKIGDVENDLEGNIIHQLSQDMNVDSFFLNHAIQKAIELYNITPQHLIDFLMLSPLFEVSKKDVLFKGVDAYLKMEYVTALHILIPQAEAAIRSLVEVMGGETLKKNRMGGLHLKTFDELLRDPIVENCFGINASFYLRILLTDQRGWNLRNDVCHGISPADSFNYMTADRLLHVILLLSLAREKVED